MTEHSRRPGAVIPQELMLARLAQSEQMREFFIQMWLQNPHLAEGIGERAKAILRPMPTVGGQRNG